MVLISFLAFSSDPPTMATQFNDKFNHFFAFFVLAGLLHQSISHPKFWRMVVLPLIVYGFFIELVQGALGYRELSLLDVAADSIGIMLFYPFRKVVDNCVRRILLLN